MASILIAIDGSKASIKALNYVVKRKRSGERLQAYILNVQRNISPRAHLITRAMIKDYQLQESEAVFEKPEIQTVKNYLQADTYAKIGDPATCIVAFAHKTKCQEIVMGSRGLGSVRGLFLGSVVNRVIQTSPIPVVVVK